MSNNNNYSGAWGADDELVTSGGWGADDELVDVSARRELPAGVKPNETAGGGRGKSAGKTTEQELLLSGRSQASKAEQNARRGTMRGALAYGAGGAIDRAELRMEPSQAGAGRGSIVEEPGERAAFTSGSQPYRDKREAINEAVDRIALGAPADKVFEQFASLGVTQGEIAARGAELGTPGFVPDTRPVAVRPGAQDGTMSPDEPSNAQGVANFGRRVAARSSQAFTGALATSGVIGPDQAATVLARDEKRLQAAMVGEELQRQLEALGKVKEWSQVGPAIRDNLAGTAVMLTESMAMSAPALAATLLGLPRVAMAAGVGVSSGSLEYGSALSDLLSDRGVSLLDADKVATLLKDDRFMADLRERGAKRGLAVGLVDALTAGIAGKFIEPAMAAVRAGEATGRAAVRRIAGGAIKELATQMAGGAGGEALAQKLTGEHKPLDIAMEALAEGVSAPFEARSNISAGRKAAELGSPAGLLAGALSADIEGRDFQPSAIAGYAARAQSPSFYDPQFVDPRATVMPRAPRVEEMPTTPWTPEQAAAMVAESQARKQAQAQAEQRAAETQRPGAAAAVTPAGTSAESPAAPPVAPSRTMTEGAGADRTWQPADQGARKSQDRAGVAQPGQLPQGSLVDEARRRIAASTQPAEEAATAAPAGSAAPATPSVEESSGERQPAARQAAKPAAPAMTEPHEARSMQAPNRPAASGGSTSDPALPPATAETFASRDAAMVAAVERRQWQRLEPAQATDGTWRLVERQQPAGQKAIAAPQHAAPPSPDSALTNAGALRTGSPATGQAAPKQEARPLAGNPPMQRQPEATHSEPGRPAEPATAPVLAESIAKAVDNTQRKPAELRADLVRQIDSALADAPEEDLPTWKRPTKDRLRQAMVDLKLGSLERAEQALRQAHDNREADAATRIGYANFDVPGDGAFKVLRSASRLADFKRLVERSAGFKAQRQAAAPELDGAQRGSPSIKAAIENMLAEGDAQAAVDYLAAKGLDAADMGLPASALAKLAGVTPTTQQADEPAGQSATEPGNGAQASRQATDATAPSMESTPPSANAEALSVRPHELTQADFIKATDFARDGNSANPWTASWRGVQLEADAAGFDHPDLGKTVVAGGRFFPTRKAAMAAAKAAHRRAVQRAQRQGDQISEKVRADYPDLAPTKPADQQPLGGEVAPDGIGIERPKLRGVSVTMTADIEETGETATFTVDAAKFLDRLDRIERKALDGRLVSADSAQFTQRLADHLAVGAEPEQARRMAMTDEFERTREERIELADNLRLQHPELFLGQPADDAAAGDEAVASDDGKPDAEKTRIADDGAALFQRRPPGAPQDDQAERNALQALSENDELFTLPRSSAATVEAIAADIDPQIKVRRTVVNNLETMYRLTMPDASFALLIERKPNPFGPQPYDYETVGGEEVPITQRPGDNPEDVPDSTVGIYIDASRLKPGGAGARVYGIAAAFAHNTGGLFIGDPNGLSDEALRRRPEQMLSSALKYGTTRHLAPHPRQARGDAALGVPPLRWVYNDDPGNIRRLVAVNLQALQNQHPDADRIDFDPDTRQFTNRVSGVSGSVASQELLFGPVDSRGGGDGQRLEEAGRRTIARGAVLRALVREEGREGATGGQRNGLLARLAGLGNDPATAGLFYSRDGTDNAQPVAEPQRLRLVRAAVSEITSGWAAAPEIEVLASMQAAPEPVRQANIRQLSRGAQGEPAAFYFEGKVYLLASQMTSRRDVAEAVAHEALGHFGLRRTFGSELTGVLHELAALREADVRAKAAEYGLNFSEVDQRLEAAEELLAELAQTQPELGLVQRAIAAIRTWLRKNLPMLNDLALSDDEIVRSFILPARAYVIDGAARRSDARGNDRATFTRRRGDGASSDAMAGLRSWLDREGAAAGAGVRFTGQAGQGAGVTAAPASKRGSLPASIDVDGRQRPTSDSAGRPLGVDDEAARDFWRRFADSAVVDAQGRPLLLHGATGAQGGFSAVQAGRLGAGMYFRESAAAAQQDGASGRRPLGSRAPTAGPGYLALRNPYLFDAADYTWPAGFIRGGALATVAQPAGPPSEPPGSPLAALLDRVLPPAQARTNLLAMARGDGDIGPALRDQLQAMGHDGLVVRFADPADGEPAYVAFDRGQAIPAWQGEPSADAIGGTGDDAGGTNDDAGGRPGGQQTRLPELIDVDGQQRATRDASGRYIAASAEAITNFWRWFAGSRAIDSLGRPIPLFHGTGKDVDAFMASRSGMLGSGVYITGNAASANEYATTFNESDEGRVMSVYARLRNPYFFAMREGWLPDWYDAPIKSGFNAREDLPWGIKLVADVMPRDSARRMIDRLLREGTINIGASLTDRLKAMGHDGIVAFDGEANPARRPDDSIWTDPKNEVVVFDPRAIKSATGNTGDFAEGTRSIRFQRRPVPAEDQPAADFTLRPFGRAGRVIEVMQDRFNRWKQAIDDVRRQGGSVTDDNNFYRAEERYWGQVGSGIEDFKDQLKVFVKAVASDGLRIEDVALYAYAQHAEERNEWVATRRPDMPDGGSGMTTAEADEILEAARQAGVEAELQRHALTLRRWIQGTRDVLFDGGLIDREAYDTWIGMFQQYVPLRGASDDAVAVAGQPAGVRRAKPKGGVSGNEAEHAQGRASQALQIIEQIAHDRAKALIRAGRNNVLRSFARFVLDNPEPSLWEVNAVETRRTVTVDEDGYRTAQETDEVVKDGRTITLKDAGQEVHILVKDAKLLEQLQRMGVDERPAWAIGALLSANRWLSRVYTSLSPVFTVINALRDTQAAAIGLIDEVGFMGAPKLFAALPSAWAQSFKAEAGRPAQDYELFRATGGVTHFMNLVTIDKQADELQAIVKDAERIAIDPRKFLPKAMRLIEALNGGVENATRLAAFNVARQSGKTTLEAASIAKNVTVNFNRKGTQQIGNAWVLFFNPAVQGTMRVAKAMTNPKVQATMGVAMLGVAALALRNAGMGDDDDGVAWWDKIPDEVKERNIVIVLPPGATAGEAVPKSKTGRYVKIPMPYGYNFFAVVANQVVDVWRHGQDRRRGRNVLKAGTKAFSAFASSWLPAQDLGRALTTDDASSAGKSAVLLAIPDALDPLARIGLNLDSFGRPMRPDSRFTENLPDSSNYFAGQHGTLFQRGAAAINQATGGTRYRAGLADVAPSSFEHLARSYGGGPVTFGLDIINALYVRQSIARPEMDAKRLPFAKQFYGVIDAETDRMTGYQRLDAAQKLTDPIRRAMTAGDGAEARAMRKEAGPVARLGDAAQQTRQQLGEIIKIERRTIDSSDSSDTQKYVKLLELAERRRKVLQRFNKVYDRAIQATERQEPEASE